MSASTPRGQRGGSTFRGARGSASATQPFRGSTRGSSTTPTRGRGRGRGGATTTGGEGLLQKLRAGTATRGTDDGATPGGRGRGTTRASTSSAPRGQGHLTKTFNTQPRPSSAPQSRSSSPAPSSMRDFMNDANARFQSLKQQRDVERAKAIKDGFLADPEKKTTLDKAITPVGTCVEMCPEFERVERMVQNMVDKSEKVKNEDTGRDMPSEAIMVKRFRRSAAGYDEQLPSDIRTPQTLKLTMDYLVDKLIGGPERLAVLHKFVWDRTRAIRNDFSIQQVSREEDVQMAVECYERIARFHVLSMHQLCNPENLLEGENFDFFQEREQLNNTLLSLIYYYDDNRDTMDFPNEPEFRAYCIIFEIQSQQPDLEDRVQSWASQLLLDKRVDTALKLYRAAGNTLFEQGPLRPMAPYSLAQNNSGSFWTALASSAVPYMLACVAEIYFAYVRFAALDALWKSGKSAPQAHQAKSQDWNLEALTEYLGFDEENQTVDFCNAFDLEFGQSDPGDTFLDFSSHSASSLDKSKIPSKQQFSHTFVEDKRCRRTLVAIINGMTVSQAIREGMIDEEDASEDQDMHAEEDDGQSFFIPETGNAFAAPSQPKSSFGSGFNPEAPTFTMTKNFGENPNSPIAKVFGEKATPQFGSKLGETAPSFSTKFGESTAATAPKFSFGEPGSSGISGASSASPKTFASTPSANAQTLNTPSQDNSSGPSARSSFGVNSPFTVSGPPTTSQGDHPTSSFTGFNFAKPAQPPTSNSPLPSNAFQSNKASEPASARPPAVEPPTSTSFKFPSSTSAASSQALQAPLPAFSAPAPSKEPFTFAFTPQFQNSTSEAAAEPATHQAAPVFGTIEQKPLFKIPTYSAEPKPQFSFAQKSSLQPPESPISPRTTQTPTSAQQPRPSPQPPQAPEAVKPFTPSFNFTLSQSPPAGQVQQPIQSQPQISNKPSAPSLSNLGHNNKAPEPLVFESTAPPVSPRQKSDLESLMTTDKSQLVHHLATLSLCQTGGLLEEYLEYSLPKILKRIVMEHNVWVHEETIERVKRRYLWRKYGAIWRYRTWINGKNRDAQKRRKRFADLLSKQAAKRKRLEEERLEIVQSMEENKRLQAEIAEQKKTEELEARKKADVKAAMEKIGKGELGKKRKSLHDEPPQENSDQAATTGPSYRHHKRSRTVGSAMPPPLKPARSSPRAASSGFRFSNTSLNASLTRASSASGFRKSSYKPPQDTTQTDFFRLLSHGLDPDTPWIPLTAAQVAEKQKKEKEEKEAKFEAAYNRRRGGLPSKQTKSPTPAAESPVAAAPSTSPAPSISSIRSETEELIEQMREARKQMDEGAQWFREETERMGKELEQQEKLRSSASSNQSARISVNGLPMVNGYEYYPAPDTPSGSMSRVERRIRATGARGLANKPFGAAKSTYTAVPMSKKSARRYAQGHEEVEEIETNGTAKKRRKHGAVDRSYKPTGEDELTEEEEELEYMAPKPSKAIKHAPPIPRSSKPATKEPAKVQATKNPFERQQNTQAEDGDEEELLEEDEEDSEHSYYHNGEDGDTEELEDEEEELLEHSDEAEEDYDEDYDASHLRATSRPYDDAPTPNTQTSHVSSGVGATADDPLELSD